MFEKLGNLGDMSKVMKKVQTMQAKMEALQQELAESTVDAESGGGLVRVTCNGKGEMLSLNIDPSILNAENKEVVEDLIIAALGEAQGKAEDRSQEEMRKFTEEMGLPLPDKYKP